LGLVVAGPLSASPGTRFVLQPTFFLKAAGPGAILNCPEIVFVVPHVLTITDFWHEPSQGIF
jgi:hypothetical protein